MKRIIILLLALMGLLTLGYIASNLSGFLKPPYLDFIKDQPSARATFEPTEEDLKLAIDIENKKQIKSHLKLNNGNEVYFKDIHFSFVHFIKAGCDKISASSYECRVIYKQECVIDRKTITSDIACSRLFQNMEKVDEKIIVTKENSGWYIIQ